eukprot:8045747-Lingulodinium_polyedra.AAC.1
MCIRDSRSGGCTSGSEELAPSSLSRVPAYSGSICSRTPKAWAASRCPSAKGPVSAASSCGTTDRR